MKVWLASLAAAFVTAGAIAVVYGPSALSSSQAAPVDLDRGAEIYAEHCASCHGANLEGQADWRSAGANGRLPAPPHDETGHTWHHPDEMLTRIIREGTAAIVGGTYESDMPGFGEQLSDSDIRDVLSFIKSKWPERERSFQAEITARSQ